MSCAMENNSKPNCCHHALNLSFSQNVALRELAKPILEVCHHVDEASLCEEAISHDVKVLFNETEAAISSEQDLNATKVDIDGEEACASLADTSVASSCSDKSDQQPISRPFVPFSVEEVSLVTDLSCWSNCYVRVVGKICDTNECLWTLVSVGEEGGPFTIDVDLRLVAKYPLPDSCIQVFAEIEERNGKPILLAKFFRDFFSVDVFFYNKGLEELKKFVPHFMDTKRMAQLRSSSVDSD